ncbi:MAG TPA: polysaccharide biosynthesis/export family protein [Pyrinomonadaceae bacterium]|jgi:polysaccharide export outer membrane protein|nr:polysaccharide biosynthesis/export family protein [Pyrinomonadaceae bacterium]
MKVKNTLLLLAVCCLFAAPVCAQEGSAQNVSVSGSGGLTTPGSALDALGVKKYLLGPGDVLDLRVFGEPQFNGTLVVNDEGNIEVPFVDDPISARCRTDREIKTDIVKALARYLKKPQVSLRVAEMRSRPAAVVFGAVRSPTRVDMRRRARLLEVLSTAGSVTEQASGDIQVFHTESVMCPEAEDLAEMALAKPETEDALALPYSLYKISELKKGKREANPYVRPGDIVIVQEAYPVYVTGAVVSPNNLYLRENLSLSRAIAQVGGPRKGAKTDKVRIYRTKPGGELEPEIIVASLDAIRKNKQADIALKPYDIIDVSDGSPWSPKNIPTTLLGLAVGGASQVVSTGAVRIIQ